MTFDKRSIILFLTFNLVKVLVTMYVLHVYTTSYTRNNNEFTKTKFITLSTIITVLTSILCGMYFLVYRYILHK